MHIHNFLKGKKEKFSFSVEIIPPPRGSSAKDILALVESLMPYGPKWVDVTSHSGDVEWQEKGDGTFLRRIKRKRPGTFGLCALIKNTFGIEAVPHVLCNGFARSETEDALIELNFLGIKNIFCIQGDETKKDPPNGKKVNKYALDLVQQVADLNRGLYLEELLDSVPTNFSVGVACYPEKHFQSPSIQYDLKWLSEKEKAGAHFAVSQMFFDNQNFYNWNARVKEAGISLPIVPGLKIITAVRQLSTIPGKFYVSFPESLVSNFLAASEDEAKHPDNQFYNIGVNYAVNQVKDLINHGFYHAHFYVMSNAKHLTSVLHRLKDEVEWDG